MTGGCDVVARVEEMRNVYKILVGKSLQMRPFGRCKFTWGDKY
jgi:hypothetical protein